MSSSSVLIAIGDEDTIAEVIELAKKAGADVQVGTPRSASAIAQAAEYPTIDPNLLEFLKQITIVVSAGAAGLSFTNEIKKLFSGRKSGQLIEKGEPGA